MASLKTLLKRINIDKTDWENFDWRKFEKLLKEDEKNEERLELSRGETIKLNIIQGNQLIYGNLGGRKRHLRAPKSSYRKPAFRMPQLEKAEPQSQSGRTYYYSAVFRNAAVLRLLAKKFTRYLRERKRNLGEPRWVYNRIIDQIDSETRSITANIREGYGRATTIEYVRFQGLREKIIEDEEEKLKQELDSIWQKYWG